MNKKKLVTLAMVFSMIAILAIGGTIAYFTDYDYNTNVMVLGNVKIDQIEEERGEDGMVEYVDGRPLYPVVNNLTSNEQYDDNYFFTDLNAVDKAVKVENKGTSEAFIRTIFAFEMGLDENRNPVDVVNVPGGVWTISTENGDKNGVNFSNLKAENNNAFVQVEIQGVPYIVGVYYYNNNVAYDSEGEKVSALEAGETSYYSLKQLYLRQEATNAFYDLIKFDGYDAENKEIIGGKYNVLALSQAVQTEGFPNAKTALDTAFGVITDDNAQEWFDTYYNEWATTDAEGNVIVEGDNHSHDASDDSTEKVYDKNDEVPQA